MDEWTNEQINKLMNQKIYLQFKQLRQLIDFVHLRSSSSPISTPASRNI